MRVISNKAIAALSTVRPSTCKKKNLDTAARITTKFVTGDLK